MGPGILVVAWNEEIQEVVYESEAEQSLVVELAQMIAEVMSAERELFVRDSEWVIKEQTAMNE